MTEFFCTAGLFTWTTPRIETRVVLGPRKYPSRGRLSQKVNFAENCSCLGLNIVRGKPKLEFG
jgi:hypothetical protein